MFRRRAFVPAVALLTSSVWGAGCGDDIPDEAAATTDLGPGGTMGTGMPTGGGVVTTVTPDGGSVGESGPGPLTSDTGFDPPEPACGNGFIDSGEQCDDGNRTDDDACNNACQVPCGLATAVVTLPPTDDSVVSADYVAVGPDDSIAVGGLLRFITTDQRGNEQVEPDVAQVLHFDPEGRLSWDAGVDNPDGELDAAGVVIDAAGDVYVAATGDDPDGTEGIFVVKLAGSDGAELWRHTFPGDIAAEDDIATGLALAPDGDVVVAGQARAGEGDDDIWARKLAADDGSEVWTSSYSGAGTGMFSTDDGGPVAVDGEGRVWVLGTEYVDFETQPPVLVRFGADGGPSDLQVRPALSGSQQDYFIVDLAVGDDGSVYAAYGRDLSSTLEFRIVRYDGDGTEVWTLTEETFAVGIGSDWRPVSVAPTGDELLVAGRVTNDVTSEGASWNEVWVARIADDASTRCQAQYRGQVRGLLPPSITPAAAAVASDARGVVSGLQAAEGDISLWVGSFRPE